MPSNRPIPLLAILIGLCLLVQGAFAQTAPASVRMRGNITALSAGKMTVKDRSGEVVELVLSDKLVVSEVYPIAIEDIKPGSYIGTAAMPQPDGSQRAIAVSVFPEASRGVGEGHRPFDLLPQSTMTNATVGDVVATPNGRQLQLKYKDGQKTLVIPVEAPIVTSRTGDRSLLVVGASVSLFAQVIDGKPTALRVNAGRNGFALPY
jgi:hypothetical protein